MAATLPIDRDLFDILVCPLCKAPLKWVGGALVSTDAATRRRYRVQDGIPIMLLDASDVVAEGEWQQLMQAEGPVGKGHTTPST